MNRKVKISIMNEIRKYLELFESDVDEFDPVLKSKLLRVSLEVRNKIAKEHNGFFENTCDIAADMVSKTLDTIELPNGYSVVNGMYDGNGHVYVIVYDSEFNTVIVDPTISQFREGGDYVVTDPKELEKYYD